MNSGFHEITESTFFPFSPSHDSREDKDKVQYSRRPSYCDKIKWSGYDVNYKPYCPTL
jgi:hypothetical protein